MSVFEEAEVARRFWSTLESDTPGREYTLYDLDLIWRLHGEDVLKEWKEEKNA
jgi:hypothetical protein